MLMIKIIVVVMIMINNNNMVDVVYTLPARAPQWPMLPFSTPHFYVFSVIRIFALPFFSRHFTILLFFRPKGVRFPLLVSRLRFELLAQRFL